VVPAAVATPQQRTGTRTLYKLVGTPTDPPQAVSSSSHHRWINTEVIDGLQEKDVIVTGISVWARKRPVHQPIQFQRGVAGQGGGRRGSEQSTSNDGYSRPAQGHS